MDKRSIPPFRPPADPHVRRYEKTLKERLAAGEVIRHFDGRFEVASMRKAGDFVEMKGFAGFRRIDFRLSDDRRIAAHWKGFCDVVDMERRRRKGLSRR